jgi:hypothetical protein
MKFVLLTMWSGWVMAALAVDSYAEWHDRSESSLRNWVAYQPTELSLQGVLTEKSGKTLPFSLHIVLVERDWAALKQQYSSHGIKYYGENGIREGKENIMSDVTVKIGERQLTVPTRALEGLLNPALFRGVQVSGTSDGYVAVDLLGSDGERAYICAFIFRDWKFSMRQVSRDEGRHVDVLK